MRMAGIVTMEQAKDRIDQLESQIEYLQEHIDGLDKEVARMERDQGTIHAAILQDKKNIAKELDSEKEKNKKLMENLKQLEIMVNELNSIKQAAMKHSNSGKDAGTNQTITKHVKTISELTEKLKSTELKLETNSKRIGMSQREINKLKKENSELKLLNSKEIKCKSAKENNTPTTKANENKSPSETKTVGVDPEEVESLNQQILKLNNRISELQSFENQYKSKINEANITESQCRQLKLQLEANAATLESVMAQNEKNSDELIHVSCERDELLKALELFSGQLAQVQSQISSLTEERDNALRLYQQVFIFVNFF